MGLRLIMDMVLFVTTINYATHLFYGVRFCNHSKPYPPEP